MLVCTSGPPLTSLPPIPPARHYFCVPVGYIDRLERVQTKQPSGRPDVTSGLLVIMAKDGRVLRVVIPWESQERNADRIMQIIQCNAFPPDIRRHLFCFEHYKALSQARSPLASSGWGIYDTEVGAGGGWARRSPHHLTSRPCSPLTQAHTRSCIPSIIMAKHVTAS